MFGPYYLLKKSFFKTAYSVHIFDAIVIYFFLIIIVSPYAIIVAQVFMVKVYPSQNTGDYTVETHKKTTFIRKLINYAMSSS